MHSSYLGVGGVLFFLVRISINSSYMDNHWIESKTLENVLVTLPLRVKHALYMNYTLIINVSKRLFKRRKLTLCIFVKKYCFFGHPILTLAVKNFN